MNDFDDLNDLTIDEEEHLLQLVEEEYRYFCAMRDLEDVDVKVPPKSENRVCRPHGPTNRPLKPELPF